MIICGITESASKGRCSWKHPVVILLTQSTYIVHKPVRSDCIVATTHE